MKEEVQDLIASKKFKEAKEKLSKENASDIAELIQDLEIQDIAKLFRLVKKEEAADVFSYLPLTIETELLAYLTDKEAVEIINEMFADDATDVLEEMPANVVTRLLKQCNSDTRQDINKLLKYPEDSAGSIMTVEYVHLLDTNTIKQALSTIRRQIADYETINFCYVVDKTRKLVGEISLKDIILANSDDIIYDIARKDPFCVKTTTDQEEVAKLFKKYDVTVMPVVDSEDRLVGIITIDDVVDIIEEETTEDIEKMAAILPTDKPYLDVSIWETWKTRIPWLLLLMISATFTGSIISNFEDKLAIIPILTAYIPMLMDTGGNAGSQASVTIIRSLSLNQIEFSDLFKIIWKELRVSILTGITLAAANYAKLMLIDRALLGYNITSSIAIAICLTIFAITIIAKIIGCTLPIITKKLGFDPAVMASPFITTIIDAVGLIVYFKIATILLM